jgi:hypothetical protein
MTTIITHVHRRVEGGVAVIVTSKVGGTSPRSRPPLNGDDLGLGVVWQEVRKGHFFVCPWVSWPCLSPPPSNFLSLASIRNLAANRVLACHKRHERCRRIIRYWSMSPRHSILIIHCSHQGNTERKDTETGQSRERESTHGRRFRVV